MKRAPTILLVEDDPDDAYFTRRALDLVGCTVELQVVRDGEAAVHYLSGVGAYGDRDAHPLPVHVLLDLKLPKRSGLEVLRWVREQPELADLPVTVMSGSGLDSDIAEATALRASGYVRKPVGLDSFVDVMRAFCQRAGLT